MNGIPHLQHLRSFSLFGLSSLTLIFDDDSVNDWNRAKVLERLASVTLPDNLQPQMGTDWSPVGQIYWYTLKSTNPQYDVMELKSLEDWTMEKQLKSVPDVVDVSSFGGPTREYQVRINPDKLIEYGLSIAQVEQQLTANNHNSGGSFIQEGAQEINIRQIGLVDRIQDIEKIVLTTQNGTPVRVKDVAVVEQGPKIRLGQIGKAVHLPNGKILDSPDAVEGIVLLRKGAQSDSTLDAIHEKVKQSNEQILPKGVTVVPFLDRSDLLHYTTHTVLHNLTEGIILVSIILFLFLGNLRGALIVALTIPFSLLFASICLDLDKVPANLLSLGALDFGMVVDGAVVMVENIVRHMGHPDSHGRTSLEIIRDAAHEVQRPVFYAIAIIITAYLPIFTLQAVEGRLFRPMALTVAFALLGALLFSILIAPVLSSFLFRRSAKEWHNPVGVSHPALPRCGPPAIRLRVAVFVPVWVLFFIAMWLFIGGHIGSEFLPHLDGGAIWARGTLAPSTGPDEGEDLMRRARLVFASFPEVTQVVSQVGRPDDGTDTTGFFNTEYFVDLKPKNHWRTVFHENKDDLIAAMEPPGGEISGNHLELLGAHFR
jgi:cobalt-zinc-cadmium resistance protein CzcA